VYIYKGTLKVLNIHNSYNFFKIAHTKRVKNRQHNVLLIMKIRFCVYSEKKTPVSFLTKICFTGNLLMQQSKLKYKELAVDRSEY